MNMLDTVKKTLHAMNLDLTVTQMEPEALGGDEEGLDFGGVYLIKFTKPAVDEHHAPTIAYATAYDVTIPGTHWEPSFEDFVEDQEFTDLADAFGRVVGLIAKDRLQCIAEADAYAESFAAEEAMKDQIDQLLSER